MQAWLFVLMAPTAISKAEQMDDKIGWAEVPRMQGSRNVLGLVNDRFNPGSFKQQELVRKVHEMVFPVLAQLGDELHPLFRRAVVSGERKGKTTCCAVVSPEQELTSDLHEALSQTASEQFSSNLSGQVQQIVVKPAHAAFATSSIDCKDMMLGEPYQSYQEMIKKPYAFIT